MNKKIIALILFIVLTGLLVESIVIAQNGKKINSKKIVAAKQKVAKKMAALKLRSGKISANTRNSVKQSRIIAKANAIQSKGRSATPLTARSKK